MKIENDEQHAAFLYGVRLGTLEERERIVAILESHQSYWENGGAVIGIDKVIELIKAEK
jgi:hypothetical protein